MGTSPLTPEHEGTDGVLGLLMRVWESRRRVFRAMYLGLLVFTVLAFLLQPLYQSTTRLMPPENQNSALALLAGSVDDRISALTGDTFAIKSTGALFIGVMRSANLQDRLIERFDLMEVYGVALKAAARETLSGNTDIVEDKRNGIITVTVTDRSPLRAQQLAAAYVEELNRLNSELSNSAARREREFLEERLKTVRVELSLASEKLSRFSSQNVTFDPREQGKATFEATAQLQAEIIITQARMRSLEQVYSPQHVRVRAARARIAELQKQLENIAGAENGRMGEGPFPSLGGLADLGVQYFNLYRDVKIQEAVYEILTKQYELAKVQEVRAVPSVRVLDPAIYPEFKFYPRRLVFILTGVVLSGFLSVLILLFQMRWQEMPDAHPLRALEGRIRSGVEEDARTVANDESFVARLLRRTGLFDRDRNTRG